MIFRETELRGAFRIDLEKHQDDRGFFARTWCRDEFARNGLRPELAQCSVSFNHRRGTLRGMHFQVAPHEETKLVRCTRGAILDVIVDLRAGSPTYLQHLAVELTAENHTALYIPGGFAHGFQTLADQTEVLYQMDAVWVPGAARGVRYNDPAFGIRWPIADPIINERDRTYPDYSNAST